MILERAISQNVSAPLTRPLRLKDADVDVQIRRTSLGSLQLRLVTTCFQDKGIDEREQQVDDILAELHLNWGQYPLSSYILLTPQEAAAQPPIVRIRLRHPKELSLNFLEKILF